MNKKLAKMNQMQTKIEQRWTILSSLLESSSEELGLSSTTFKYGILFVALGSIVGISIGAILLVFICAAKLLGI